MEWGRVEQSKSAQQTQRVTDEGKTTTADTQICGRIDSAFHSGAEYLAQTQSMSLSGTHKQHVLLTSKPFLTGLMLSRSTQGWKKQAVLTRYLITQLSSFRCRIVLFTHETLMTSSKRRNVTYFSQYLVRPAPLRSINTPIRPDFQQDQIELLTQ